MSTTGHLSSALAGLPIWLQSASQPGADAASFEANLLEWVRTSGFRAAGVIWPCENTPVLAKTALNGRVTSTSVPLELADVVRRLRQGESTAAATSASGTLRVYAALRPSGRPMGVFWAERPFGLTTSDIDKQLVALTARLIEESQSFAAVSGPSVDSEKLLQRLQDAAVMAGRMAHDFDNILTGIIGFSDLALPLLPAGSTQARFVGEIGKVGQRGILFTQQLHQLSRSGATKPNPGHLGAAVAKEEARLRPAMGAAVRLEKDLPANLPYVAADAMPLQSIVGHLLENAIEACGDKGTVTIHVRPVELTEADTRTYLGRAAVGANLEVSFTDSGPGITPEIRRRLFAEPFYTTKVRHRGLGLAVVYRTLCVHRGGIRLEPVPPPGSGTVARFVLPLAAVRTPVTAPAVLGAIPVGG